MLESAVARAFSHANGRVAAIGVRRNADTDLLEALFRASGGNLANAARFLDATMYAEGRCAFLACRALDAFEDLAAETSTALDGIRKVAAYLMRHDDEPPNAAVLSAARTTDELECAVVRALPELRRALESLDVSARQRVQALIETMSAGMTRELESRGLRESYGATVLGSACAYVFSLLEAESDSPPDFAAIGTLLQAANDLRDLEFDTLVLQPPIATERRLQLELIVAEMAPQVVGNLGQLRFGRFSRPRGAVTYLMLTTANFFLRRCGHFRPSLVQHPALGGIRAAASPAVYERALLECEELIHDCVVRGCMNWTGSAVQQAYQGRRTPRRSRLQSILEERIAELHPDPDHARILGHGGKLLHAALRLCRELPATPLEPQGKLDPDAAILMISDYLLACSIGLFAKLGADTVAEVGISAAALARAAEDGGSPGDFRGEIARLLSTLAGRARGLPDENVRQGANRDQDYAARLCKIDHAPWWRPRIVARRALSSAPLSCIPLGNSVARSPRRSKSWS